MLCHTNLNTSEKILFGELIHPKAPFAPNFVFFLLNFFGALKILCGTQKVPLRRKKWYLKKRFLHFSLNDLGEQRKYFEFGMLIARY